MTKDFPAIQQSVVDGAGALREALPDVIKGYGTLGGAIYKQGALDPRIKELIALALAIAPIATAASPTPGPPAIAAPAARRWRRRSAWRSTSAAGR